MNINSLESFQQQVQPWNNRIALEADFLADLSKTIAAIVPNMVSATKEFLSTRQFVPNEAKPRPDFLAKMDKLNYAALMALEINVPEGFAGNLETYTKLLQESAVHAAGVVQDVLEPYNKFLSGLISNDNARMDSSNVLVRLARRETPRENHNRQIDKQFRLAATNGTAKYGKVIGRNSEWDGIVLGLVAAGKTMAYAPNDTVQKSVDTCLELLDALKTQAKTGGLDKTSGAQLRNLSEGTLSVAREVEFFSITSYRLHLMNVALERNIALINEKF